MTEKSLYDRLGGKTAITAVVDGCRTRGRRHPHQRQVCDRQHPPPQIDAGRSDHQASGGPCAYTGRDMKSTPRRHGRQQQRLPVLLVGDLVASLNTFKVPEQEEQLLRALGR
ncbi:MAG: hypothetical protein MRJ92_02375 [Nitrospira sp.]|nr:hypothetical protein [Nitrospira sp.]